MNQTGSEIRTQLERPLLVTVVIGVVLLVVSVLLGLANLEQFFRSYLYAYFFWLGVSLGCLGLALLHHVSGGAWGAVMLRFNEAGMLTLPLMAILFIPVALGVHYLYPWANPTTVAQDPILQGQSVYLNIPFFIGRAVFYFLTWLGTAFLLRRWSLERDRTDDPGVTRRLRVWSALAGLLFGLTGTFSAIDWTMSLESDWSSTIYAMMVIVGEVLAAFAFVVVVIALLDTRKSLAGILSPTLFNDLGSLLLAFVMLWAYMAFSQFMLIWAGNLIPEIPYYTRRLSNSWQWISLVVALASFVIPFLLLVSRDLKRNPRTLAAIALLLFLARVVNGYWLIMPAFYPTTIQFSWLDLALPIGIGGLWIGLFLWQLRAAPLVSVGDNTLAGAVELAHEAE